MSSIAAKALLHFERSRNLDQQERDLLQEAVQSLTTNSNNATTNRAPSVQTSVSSELTQQLDIRLCAHMTKKEYDDAMQVALEMQKTMPKSYCGYQRAAQIHLIRNEFDKARQVYRQGLDEVSRGDNHALLHKSAEDAVDIFDQVAIDLAKNGLFQKAHDMAEWITWLLPRSPTGYIRTGEISEMQGKYSVAEEVYNRGVSQVVSVAPKNLDSLVQHLVNVKRQIKRNPRCDFITQLPFEVASEVLAYLSSCDLVRCMEVSRSWKDRILQSSKAWRVITLNMQRDKLDMTTIQRIKSFVQKIIFISIPNTLHNMNDLLTSTADNEFANLVDIEWYTNNAVMVHHIPTITRVFECVNLTSLYMNVEETDEGILIPLEQVLECCPNLKQLTYFLLDERRFPVNSDFVQRHEPTRITHLSLGWKCDYDNTSVATDYFVQLIRLFPNLVYLYISYCDPNSLPTITQNLPRLRQLIIDGDESSIAEFQKPHIRDSTVDGLQSIQILGVLNPKHVMDTITKYSSTLEYVHMDLYKTGKWYDSGVAISTDWDWKSISKINAPVLRTLCMYTNYFWPFDNLVGDCPVLKKVILEYNEDSDDSDDDYYTW